MTLTYIVELSTNLAEPSILVNFNVDELSTGWLLTKLKSVVLNFFEISTEWLLT